MTLLKKIPLRAWITIICFVIIGLISYLRLLNTYELISYDLQLKLRPCPKQADNILIVEISDDTLTNLGEWPLSRDYHATLVHALKKYGARLIVFDLLFSEPSENDATFAHEIQEAGNVYLSLTFDRLKIKSFPAEADIMLADVLQPLKQSAAGICHINPIVDSDGKTRRAPLLIRHQGVMYPLLGFKAACDWMGLDCAKIVNHKNKIIVDNKLSLPLLEDGSFLVNYPDTWKKSFKHLSYFQILKAFTEEEKGLKPQIDLSQIKDKICFIGLTAAGTTDIRPSPLENIYPMLGLHASVFNSIVNRQFITDAGVLFNTIIAFIVFIISLVICLKFSPVKAFAGILLVAFGYFAIATASFAFFSFWVDLFLPLLVVMLTYIGSTSYRFFNETKKRLLLEKELDIAQAIQKSFLPQDIKELCGISISSFMQPAKFVAGDLYDIVALRDSMVGVFIGDVSGKGVPASLIMAQTISLFRVFAHQYKNPSEVLMRLNKELYGRFEGRFVTCLYMLIDPQNSKILVSSAGHSPVLEYRSDKGAIEEIDLQAGMPLGIMEDMEYGDVSFPFKKSDKLMVFTDGLPEARNREGRDFGLDLVNKILFEHGQASSERILKIIKEELFKFSLRAPQHDDITVIVLANRKDSG